MFQNLSNLTKVGRIVTILALTFGLSTIFYVKIITGGEGIAPWTLPLMLCPALSAITPKSGVSPQEFPETQKNSTPQFHPLVVDNPPGELILCFHQFVFISKGEKI